jgi:hypothetical protein
MKIKIQFKDPDAIGDAIQSAVVDELSKIEGLSDDEKCDLKENRIENVADAITGFIRWGEYVMIEIDTVSKTARVVPVDEK